MCVKKEEKLKAQLLQDFFFQKKKISIMSTRALFKAKAIYTYASDKPSDLSFQQDDIIDVIGKRPDGWWIVGFSRVSLSTRSF